jgi:hypothetical protein
MISSAALEYDEDHRLTFILSPHKSIDGLTATARAELQLMNDQDPGHPRRSVEDWEC